MYYFSIADCVVISCPFPFVFSFSSRLWTSCHFLQAPDPSLTSQSYVYIPHYPAPLILTAHWSSSLSSIKMKVSIWSFGTVDFDSTLCSLGSAQSLRPQPTETPCPGSGQRAKHHHPQPPSQPPELGVSRGSSTLQTENDPMCVDKLTVHKTAGIPTLK